MGQAGRRWAPRFVPGSGGTSCAPPAPPRRPSTPGAARRLMMGSATAEGAALVNAMGVSGGAAFTGAEGMVRDLVGAAGGAA